jgi:hypothetical protein
MWRDAVKRLAKCPMHKPIWPPAAGLSKCRLKFEVVKAELVLRIPQVAGSIRDPGSGYNNHEHFKAT